MQQINIHMIFEGFKQLDFWVIVFILVKISIDKAEMNQTNLLESMVKFNNKARPSSTEKQGKKQNTFDSVNTLYAGQKVTLNAFRSRIFPIKEARKRASMYVSYAFFGLSHAIENIKSWKNALKINNSTCTSKSR